MLSDIVVDANILVHANNFHEPRQSDAREFLLLLHKSESLLCVDEGFHIDEAKNRSIIGYEYLKHLSFGMLGFAVVAYLASSSRIKVVPRKVPEGVSKKIRMKVGNTHDRVYVRVAFNAEDRTLASHDYKDLPQGVRGELHRTINVRIMSAREVLPILAEV